MESELSLSVYVGIIWLIGTCFSDIIGLFVSAMGRFRNMCVYKRVIREIGFYLFIFT